MFFKILLFLFILEAILDYFGKGLKKFFALWAEEIRKQNENNNK